MAWRCELCNCDFSRSDKLLNHNKTETHSLRVLIKELQEENNQLKEIINNARSALNMDTYAVSNKIEVPKVQKKRGSKPKSSKEQSQLETCLIEANGIEEQSELQSDVSKESPIEKVESPKEEVEPPKEEVDNEECIIETPPPKKRIIKKPSSKKEKIIELSEELDSNELDDVEDNTEELDKIKKMKIKSKEDLHNSILSFNDLCRDIADKKIAKGKYEKNLEILETLYSKIIEFSEYNGIDLEMFRYEDTYCKLNLYLINNYDDFISLINKKLSKTIVSNLEEHMRSEFYTEDNSVDAEIIQKEIEIEKKKKEYNIQLEKMKKQLEKEDAIINQLTRPEGKVSRELPSAIPRYLPEGQVSREKDKQLKEEDKVLEQIKKKKVPEIKMELYSSKGKKI